MEAGRRGAVRISDQVIAKIAGFTAQESSWIISMVGGLYEDFSKRLSGHRSTKGVQVKVVDQLVTIDLRINVAYGHKIDEVCRKLQEKIRDVVEQLTGLTVREVNIRVEGIKV